MRESVVAQVAIEGSKDPWYLLAEDLRFLESVALGAVPDAWLPAGPTTAEEAVFLAPLDIVSARGRAAQLFGFEYLWEVYKPVELRRWGYYTLPVLWGDRLAARLDPKLDRKTGTLRLHGFWTEPDTPVEDPRFEAALGRGLARFARMMGATRVDVSAIAPEGLRRGVAAELWDAENAEELDP